MKMLLFETMKLKFDHPNWSRDPELALIDTILEEHPELISMFESDIKEDKKKSVFGRGDVPSVEQIVRAAIYKEIKKLNYRELDYHQEDSRICAEFIKIDPQRPYSYQVYQKYISRIPSSKLEEFLYHLNGIAIQAGLEDINKISQDSTVVETNIHYPTNNALVWDSIKESHRLLGQLQEEISGMSIRDYTKTAKRTYYKINNTKKSGKQNKETGKNSVDKRRELFIKQLITFTKCINQVANIVKKKEIYKINLLASVTLTQLESLLSLMKQVYSMTERHEIKGEHVPSTEKIFSIYESHTDIIMKGNRELQFGHKINIATGKSNLILACETLKGNPSDSSLYQDMLDKVIETYKIVPRDIVTDGGYASKLNIKHAQKRGILNIVFNKVTGSMHNITNSKNIETRLKKWRSSIEAVISNVKRGFNLFRCLWKGYAHFKQKVLWSVIAYNIRVMSCLLKNS
jgi:IS5 family transposase